MLITIHTSHGSYDGRTVESIVRREYGRAAFVRWSRDRNDPRAGYIVRHVPACGSDTVLATLISVDE